MHHLVNFAFPSILYYKYYQFFNSMSLQLTREQRAQIVVLSQNGKSTREIAEMFDTNQSTVARTLKKFTLTNTFTHSGGNGRPSKCNEEILRQILAKNKKKQ